MVKRENKVYNVLNAVEDFKEFLKTNNLNVEKEFAPLHDNQTKLLLVSSPEESNKKTLIYIKNLINVDREKHLRTNRLKPSLTKSIIDAISIAKELNFHITPLNFRFIYYRKKETFNFFVDILLEQSEDFIKTLLNNPEAFKRAKNDGTVSDSYSDIRFNFDKDQVQTSSKSTAPIAPIELENTFNLDNLKLTLKSRLVLGDFANYLFNNEFYSENIESLCKLIGEERLENFSLNEEFSSNSKKSPIERNNSHTKQVIFYGAPGTGKSFKLNEKINNIIKEEKLKPDTNVLRVTFYPTYTYGQFVGSFKPFTDSNKKLTYSFVPGIFTRILINVLKNPQQNYFLIIEEINRANVASVFGDIFQLLDRNEEGASQYEIANSIELHDYIEYEFNNSSDEQQKQLKKQLGEELSKLVIPSNLHIWATMNSADQGVMPMDSAFKRRWEFEYFGIETEELQDSYFNRYQKLKNEIEELDDKIIDKNSISWHSFRKFINESLIELSIPEDKLIGPYFISKKELSDQESIRKAIRNKLLMYLYDDVVRAFRKKFFNPKHSGTFSKLIGAFDKDALDIFKKDKIEQIVEFKLIESIEKTEETEEVKVTEEAVPTN